MHPARLEWEPRPIRALDRPRRVRALRGQRPSCGVWGCPPYRWAIHAAGTDLFRSGRAAFESLALVLQTFPPVRRSTAQFESVSDKPASPVRRGRVHRRPCSPASLHRLRARSWPARSLNTLRPCWFFISPPKRRVCSFSVADSVVARLSREVVEAAVPATGLYHWRIHSWRKRGCCRLCVSYFANMSAS